MPRSLIGCLPFFLLANLRDEKTFDCNFNDILGSDDAHKLYLTQFQPREMSFQNDIQLQNQLRLCHTEMQDETAL